LSANAYIGIDLGTSGCRAIAIDDANNQLALSQLPHPQTRLNTTETDPEQQWYTVKTVLSMLVQQLNAYQIKRIAVDATSGSVMLVNHQGNAISPILLYNDDRALTQSKQIAAIAPQQSAAHGVTSGLAKLMWLKQNKQSIYSALHQTDWINYKLGAEIAITDYNNALKTGYDPIKQQWPEWLSKLFPVKQLPSVVAPGQKIGELNLELAEALSISHPVEIVAGTTDSVAASIATGATLLGTGISSLGSTLVLKLLSHSPLFVPKHGIYSHRLGDKWLVSGASNTGGHVLRHYFSDKEIARLSELIDLTKQVPDYYPLLNAGERFPTADPELAPRLTPIPEDESQFLYGLLNGIANIEAKGYDLFKQFGASKLTEIYSVGGGAKNLVWQTIRQQKLNVDFKTPCSADAAFGSAILAREGLTKYEDSHE
jgi:sugar (pentulose or hexulose) kinase